jgi:hypothetical protein
MSRQMRWCSSPIAHRYATKRGHSPTHPRDDRPIDSNLAAFITQQYFNETEDDKFVMAKGDVLCRTCYETAQKQFISQLSTVQNEKNELWDYNAMEMDHSRCLRKRIVSNVVEKSSDDISSDELSSSSQSSSEEMDDEDRKYHQNQSKSMLNEIFKIVGVSPIADM